jgi:peptidoglycan/LPS O-acetylase OafA/YrhL
MGSDRTEYRTQPGPWHDVTLAVLGGLAVASVLFAHVAVVQTPGLDPPPEMVALFVAAAALATVGYLLVRSRAPLGYPVGVFVGLVVIAEAVAVVAGVFGPAGPETNPVGPVVYVGLAVVVVVSSGVAWRRRPARTGGSAGGTR